jgi:hypothetical protein
MVKFPLTATNLARAVFSHDQWRETFRSGLLLRCKQGSDPVLHPCLGNYQFDLQLGLL